MSNEHQDLATLSTIRVATFNLFNYLEPPNAFYEFEKIYTAEQWAKKQNWIKTYLAEHQPDVIGFQEVFSITALKNLLASQGYDYFACVDTPDVVDDFIYRSPVVAIASRYPIVDVQPVLHDAQLATEMGLVDFSFSREVLRTTIELPQLGKTDCYVVHLKSKRSSFEHEKSSELSYHDNLLTQLKQQIAGGWASSIQRGSEATLLLNAIINRREQSQYPILLMGDFNNNLNDGILNHLLIDNVLANSTLTSNEHFVFYGLYDSWHLYQAIGQNELQPTNTSESKNKQETVTRKPTHYWGASGSVLDYILCSCEFDSGYQKSLYEVSDYQVYDRHLINSNFAVDDQSTDHGVVLVEFTLRN